MPFFLGFENFSDLNRRFCDIKRKSNFYFNSMQVTFYCVVSHEVVNWEGIGWVSRKMGVSVILDQQQCSRHQQDRGKKFPQHYLEVNAQLPVSYTHLTLPTTERV